MFTCERVFVYIPRSKQVVTNGQHALRTRRRPRCRRPRTNGRDACRQAPKAGVQRAGGAAHGNAPHRTAAPRRLPHMHGARSLCAARRLRSLFSFDLPSGVVRPRKLVSRVPHVFQPRRHQHGPSSACGRCRAVRRRWLIVASSAA